MLRNQEYKLYKEIQLNSSINSINIVNKLNSDIINLIITYLPYKKDLAHLRLTCKFMNDLIESSNSGKLARKANQLANELQAKKGKALLCELNDQCVSITLDALVVGFCFLLFYFLLTLLPASSLRLTKGISHNYYKKFINHDPHTVTSTLVVFIPLALSLLGAIIQFLNSILDQTSRPLFGLFAENKNEMLLIKNEMNEIRQSLGQSLR